MTESAEQQSVITVRTALAQRGVSGQVRRLDDSARTAVEAAGALGIEVGQIASSLIFLADGEPVLVIASGGHRVDTSRLSAVLSGATITKAPTMSEQPPDSPSEAWHPSATRSP